MQKNSEKLFKVGMSFEEFVNLDKDSYREKILEIYNNIDFSEEMMKRVQNIDKKINILIYAEIWCPDCMINVPVVQKMKEINKNIQISILGREESENIKIPTFIFFDENFKEIGNFVERPKLVKDIENSQKQPVIIVTMRKYKNGFYVEETLKDILHKIGY